MESNITIIDSEQQRFHVLDIPRELVANRSLLWSLGKNDFKQKFAGSYLGVIWAFVQPIVTVLVYWFVFQMALNVGTQATKAGIQAPYVLWLLGGLVPWFFFNDALVNGANALISYEYLVKKVVFQVSILPVVKVFSSLFVHIFFVVFTLLMYALYGYFPTVYMLQIVYYFAAMLVLSLGLVYLCAALTALFRDMSQLITIALQVLIWMTPIAGNAGRRKSAAGIGDYIKTESDVLYRARLSGRAFGSSVVLGSPGIGSVFLGIFAGDVCRWDKGIQ